MKTIKLMLSSLTLLAIFCINSSAQAPDGAFGFYSFFDPISDQNFTGPMEDGLSVRSPAIFITPAIHDAGNSLVQYRVEMARDPLFENDLRTRIGNNNNQPLGIPTQRNYWFNQLECNTDYFVRTSTSINGGESWGEPSPTFTIHTIALGNGRIRDYNAFFDGTTITRHLDVFGGLGTRLIYRNYANASDPQNLTPEPSVRGYRLRARSENGNEQFLEVLVNSNSTSGGTGEINFPLSLDGPNGMGYCNRVWISTQAAYGIHPNGSLEEFEDCYGMEVELDRLTIHHPMSPTPCDDIQPARMQNSSPFSEPFISYQVSPNPFTSVFSLKVPYTQTIPLNISISTPSGIVIYKETSTTNQNNLLGANLKRGMYFVTIQYDGNVDSFKVIKN